MMIVITTAKIDVLIGSHDYRVPFAHDPDLDAFFGVGVSFCAGLNEDQAASVMKWLGEQYPNDRHSSGPDWSADDWGKVRTSVNVARDIDRMRADGTLSLLAAAVGE